MVTLQFFGMDHAYGSWALFYQKVLFSLWAFMYGLWKSTWKVKAPTKVAFSVWLAALGKILTVYLLQRKGIIIVNWCSMCKQNRDLGC